MPRAALGRQWNDGRYLRSMLRVGDVQTTTQLLYAELHTLHPNTAIQLKALAGGHANPIVPNREFETIQSSLQFGTDARRMRVAMNVDERLLRYPEKSHCRRPIL